MEQVRPTIPAMTSQELAELNRTVTEHNARLKSELQKLPQQVMGRDEFLKLLLAQLAHQDPTAPVQDKEFVAQMAQFSSLEQMTNMAADFSKMARMMQGGEASSALGRNVEIFENDTIIQGTVQAVSREEIPQILVNGNYYQWDQVTRIYNEGDQDL